MDKNEIIEKVEKDIPLTREETIFYLTEIQGVSLEDAEMIISKGYEDVKEIG